VSVRCRLLPITLLSLCRLLNVVPKMTARSSLSPRTPVAAAPAQGVAPAARAVAPAVQAVALAAQAAVLALKVAPARAAVPTLKVAPARAAAPAQAAVLALKVAPVRAAAPALKVVPALEIQPPGQSARGDTADTVDIMETERDASSPESSSLKC